MARYSRETRTRNDVPLAVETAWYVTVKRRTKRSAQGQTLLAGDQLDSWPGLVCPFTRIEPISESVGCQGYTETPSQP